jgi:hypothetical protein
MGNLSSALLAAQNACGRIPYMEIKAKTERLHWECVYAGSEEAGHHSVSVLADGSLLRARISPPSDGSRLYIQRIENGSLETDFATWQYANIYDVRVLSIAACEEETSLFYITGNRRIERMVSYDAGKTWGTPEIVDYTPSTYINGIWAEYDREGDIHIFFADMNTLWIKRLLGSIWQARSSWSHQTGVLTGISGVYDRDFCLVLSGETLDGEARLWRLGYGNEGKYEESNWSTLVPLAGAPADSGFSFNCPSISKNTGFKCFYNEVYTVVGGYTRTMSTEAVGSRYLESEWSESEPFYKVAEFGYSLVAASDCYWLCSSNEVLRAEIGGEWADVTADVTGVECALKERSGELVFELDNAGGVYNTLPRNLQPGGVVTFSPGYITGAGSEVGRSLTFTITGTQRFSGEGKSNVRIYCGDGWSRLRSWRARHHYTWNDDFCVDGVSEILSYILGRVGITLDSDKASAKALSFAPYFSINPGSDGAKVTEALLSFVGDYLRIDGNDAFLLDPAAATQTSFYYYCANSDTCGQPIYSGTYFDNARPVNHYKVIARDEATDAVVSGSAYDWESIAATGERLKVVQDYTAGNLADAEAGALLMLERATRGEVCGRILAPVNVGIQLYDVVEITDLGAGIDGDIFRVLGIKTVYRPGAGKYEQELTLGRV